MQKKMKKTPLYDWHVKHGANMVRFGEYKMPLWYPAGAKKEHLMVLTKAGIFDTSHMALVMVKGPDAFELLQLCFTRDLDACIGKNKSPLTPGRCVYGAFLNESGNVIDDAIVYQLEHNNYMTIVNAGMGNEIAEHLEAQRGNRNLELIDLTDKVGKMDIQGPLSCKILMKILVYPEKVLKKMGYFSFKGYFNNASLLADEVRLGDGTPILLSRTGYTGEFGFEIFIDPDHLVNLWQMILDAGKTLGIMHCGLAARDSLRVGALLPLSHQDIGSWPFINNPWTFTLPFNADKTRFTKKFIGDVSLLSVDNPEYTYAFTGYDLRKVSAEDSAAVLDPDGNNIGTILTCVTDMGIGRYGDKIYSVASPNKPEAFNPKGLSCGFVKVKTKLDPGQIVELKDNRRKIKVMIVNDIRPDRTAQCPIEEIITKEEKT